MPANAATVAEAQGPGAPSVLVLNIDCEEKKSASQKRPWSDCQVKQMCNMVKDFNESKYEKKKTDYSPGRRMSDSKAKQLGKTKAEQAAHNTRNKEYGAGLSQFSKEFDDLVAAKGADDPDVKAKFNDECAHEEWKEKGAPTPMPRGIRSKGMSPDHVHDVSQGGPTAGPNLMSELKWADSLVNQTVGRAMSAFDPEEHDTVAANPNCGCSP